MVRLHIAHRRHEILITVAAVGLESVTRPLAADLGVDPIAVTAVRAAVHMIVRVILIVSVIVVMIVAVTLIAVIVAETRIAVTMIDAIEAFRMCTCDAFNNKSNRLLLICAWMHGFRMVLLEFKTFRRFLKRIPLCCAAPVTLLHKGSKGYSLKIMLLNRHGIYL